MPQTPILALPYPADTDPADVPTDMGELANRVEAVRGAINGLASLGADGRVPSAQLPAAVSTVVPLVTTLPASPTDGQEVILVDSLSAAQYLWRFRYNAGASSPHKWEFVGGTPRLALGISGVVNTANAWTDPPTGAVMTIPWAGIYNADVGISAQGAAGIQLFAGPMAGAGAPPNYGSGVTEAGNAFSAISSALNQVAVSAAGDIRLRVFVGATPVTFNAGFLRVTPLRIS